MKLLCALVTMSCCLVVVAVGQEGEDTTQSLPVEPLFTGRFASVEDSLRLLTLHGQFTRVHRNNLDSGRVIAQQAYSLAHASIAGGDHPDLMISIHNAALVAHRQRRYDQAESLYVRALQMRRRLYRNRDHIDLVISLSQLGRIYYVQHRYHEAEEVFAESCELARRLFGKTDHVRLAMSIHELGSVLEQLGRHKGAERMLVEALDMHRRLLKGKDHLTLVGSLNNLGLFYTKLGECRKAEPLLRESLAISRRLFKDQESGALAIYVNNLGKFHLECGRYSEALPFLFEALDILRRAYPEEDHHHIAASLNNVGRAYDLLGNDDMAERYLHESLRMQRRIFNGRSHRNLAATAYNLAEFYISHKRYSDAEPLYREVATVITELLEQSRYFETERQQLQFLTTMAGYRREVIAFAMQHSDALPNASVMVLELLLNTNAKVLDATAEQRRTLAKLRRSDSATQRLWERFTFQHQQLADLLADGPSKDLPQHLWAARRDSLRELTGNLEKHLVCTSAALSLSTKKVTREQLLASLPANAAAIEFLAVRPSAHDSTATTRYAALLLRGGDPHLIPLCNQQQLEPLLTSSDAGSPARYLIDNGANRALHDLLWQPLDSLLDGITSLYIVRAGDLHSVSFASLRDADDRYLIDRYRLRLLSSLREIPELQHSGQATASGTAIVLGGAEFSIDSAALAATVARQRMQIAGAVQWEDAASLLPDHHRGGDYFVASWESLDGSRREAESLAERLHQHGWTCRTFVGREATEDALKLATSAAQSPRLLHVATHGFAFDKPDEQQETLSPFERGGAGRNFQFAENPLLRSALVLTGANRTWLNESLVEGADDGILTAYEVAGLDFSSTELVVLSACQTALGEVHSSEGVIGLQRAFLIAGAEAVLVSLWPVSDRATMELMEEFYEGWLSGKPKDAALREAKRQMRDSGHGAEDWGAFVLVEG